MSGKQIPEIAELTAEEQKALDLRVAGKTFPQIAKELGCSLGTAYGRVQQALAYSREAMASKGAEYRELEANRLNKLLESMWPVAIGEMQVLPKMDDEGNTRKTIEEATLEGQQKAVDRVLKIMERRAKMLGLDAPAKTELTGKDGQPMQVHNVDPVELAKRIELLAAQLPSGEKK